MCNALIFGDQLRIFNIALDKKLEKRDQIVNIKKMNILN